MGTVSMNMPESNHIFADLGIPYMDTVTGSFAAQTPAKTQFSPIRSANFRLDVSDGRLRIAGDLNANLKIGDDTFAQFVRSIDDFIEVKGINAPAEEGFDLYLRQAPETLPEIDTLDLRDANITTVIWATGYRYDFGWIDCPVFDTQGAPVQRRGVTEVPGLYFLGLPRMHKVKSAFLWGVGEDAEHLANHIAARATKLN